MQYLSLALGLTILLLVKYHDQKANAKKICNDLERHINNAQRDKEIFKQIILNKVIPAEIKDNAPFYYSM
ncbi:MAG: hypothetical protein LBH92_05740 [Bacteroidales bacterium]|jgi:hypothetical protein|nr:hypothetical protein [Bacteroidales bacterium]